MSRLRAKAGPAMRWLAVAGAALSASGAVSHAGAQAWTAQLVLSPMPSPFVSDWEVDPTVAELIVTNGTSTATGVTFHYTLTRGNQVVLRGVTDPHTVAGNESKVFNASTTFGGKADWNRELQDLVARTGRLPEGEYQGCVALVGPGGAVLIERECATFTVAYPDPPFLVYPMNGDTVRSQAPMFEWQPVQLPAMADARVGYVLQVAEVNATTKQSPEVALSSNILHYVEPGLVETSHQYPVGALPLVSGRTYAWRVQALDATGKPIASNQGRSEIWTFVYREPESEAQRAVARVELTASRDTLRFAGDTARYVAQAFDADNVEIVGRTVQWRTLDTTIARVDSGGIVTSAREGETRVVATVDGVVDSATAVMAPRALAVRFETYDAATESPPLLELIKSGSFDEVLPQLMARLESGDFAIPVPGRPRSASSETRDAADATSTADPSGSPAGADVAANTSTAAGTNCALTIRGVTVSVSKERKVFAMLLDDPQTEGALVRCGTLPAPEGHSEESVSDTAFNRSALFVVSWEHPGVPRAFVAFKGAGGLPLPFGGTRVRVRYAVVNPIRPVSVGADMLPASFARFFGDDSFEAGVGITLYSKRSCPAEQNAVPRGGAPPEGLFEEIKGEGALCFVLRKLHPDNPEITTQAFLGVTASESSVGLGGGRGVSGSVGASRAYGFSIFSTLPVRRYHDSDGFRVDSTQVGFLFAVQDSITASREQYTSEAWARDTSATRDNVGQGWSVGISPTVTVWFTGSKDRKWQIDGAIGVEWDPSAILSRDTFALVPKLVISGVLQSTLMLGPVRVGSPQFVFTTPLGQLVAQRDATTLALSGAWGIGPADWGLMQEEEEAAPTDAGSARAGAASGFEELGRGQVTLEWERMTEESRAQDDRRAAASRDTVQAKQQRDSAMARVTRKLHEYNASKQRVDTAAARLAMAKEKARDDRRANQPAPPNAPAGLAPPSSRENSQAELAAATAEHDAAVKDLATRKAELDALRQARTDARDALRPRACLANIKNRCVTWKASLSLQNGVLTDLLVALGRLLTGTL